MDAPVAVAVKVAEKAYDLRTGAPIGLATSVVTSFCGGCVVVVLEVVVVLDVVVVGSSVVVVGGGLEPPVAKASSWPFVSLATRFEALESNATTLPSALMDGYSLWPFAGCPFGATLTSFTDL